MRGVRMFGSMIAMTLVSPSFAQTEGQRCSNSSQCGELRCIEERCRDVSATLRAEASPIDTSAPTSTLGHRAMFGDGHDYGLMIAIADIVATLSEPFLMAATLANDGSTASTLGVICFVPTAFAGSTVHFVHRRAIPGIISFFAWTSLAGSTFVVGGLFGLGFQHGFEFNSVAAWAGGLTFGAAGAALVTWLDVWMARTDVSKEEPTRAVSVRLSPGIAPTRGGAMVSFNLSW